MKSHEMLKKRLNARGTSAEVRMANDKLKTLYKALSYSYQAETIEKDEFEYKALINNNKLKMDYDDKIISIPFEAGLSVGDIFFWPRINQHWIIYLRHYSEDAYFRGYIRRAQHTLRWKNQYGKVVESWGAVRGPVETKIKSEMKSGNAFDVPNYTLSVIIPYNETTKELKRYSRVAVNGKMWEVAVADDISEPGVIDLQLLEHYIDKEKDKDVLENIELCKLDGDKVVCNDIRVTTSLDGIEELEPLEPFKLWALVEQDGVRKSELVDDCVFEIVSGSGAIAEDGHLTPFESNSKIGIVLKIPKIGYEQVFSIDVKDGVLPPAKLYLIEGDENVRSYGKTAYHLKLYLDGISSQPEVGKWRFNDNNKLFTVENVSSDMIELKWRVGLQGSVSLYYDIDGQQVAEKIIEVKSLI